MNKRILTSVLCGALLIIMAIPFQAQAQWGVGASYELRDESPESGFGVRVERNILGKVPVVDLRLRAHFSYFTEEINSGSTDLKNYDYGVAAIGGASVGLITPYVGLGIGSTTFDAKVQNAPNPGSENSFFWNALVGAEVSPVPMVSPFVEYRLMQATKSNFGSGSDGRLVFGVTFNF